MRHFPTLIIFTLLASPAYAGDAECRPGLDGDASVEILALLDSALAIAPEIKAAHSRSSALKAEVSLARAALLPSVEAVYSQGRTSSELKSGRNAFTEDNYPTQSANVTMRQPLYIAPAYGGLRASKYDSSAAQHAASDEWQSIVERVLLSYMEVSRYQSILAMTNKRISELERSLARAHRLMSLGEGSRLEVMEIQAELSRLAVDLATNQGRLAMAKRSLRALSLSDVIDDRDVRALRLDPTQLPQVIEASYWVKLMRMNNPQLAALRARAAAANALVDAASAKRLPTASLVVMASDRLSGDEYRIGERARSAYIGIEVGYRLFQGGALRAERDRTKHLSNEAMHRYESKERELERDVIDAVERIGEISVRARATTQLLLTLTDVADASKISVQAGEGTVSDVLAKQMRVYRAQIEKEEEAFRAAEAWISLWRLSGVLDRERARTFGLCFQMTHP